MFYMYKVPTMVLHTMYFSVSKTKNFLALQNIKEYHSKSAWVITKQSQQNEKKLIL
jgi:hypothetical protein